ncbi:C2H2 type zinc-finger-domain-containing protein [Rhexocercosporidium sp. MPI-PUGE-AT-0058]|nr:C2H2 type zinc-finger-domain-containing protein [Rhexocercosporidium sp. MPI-PUGE-AT-0058]
MVGATTTSTTTTTTNTANSNMEAIEIGCQTCREHFTSREAQREHMREEWHVYNLKRKMASLPPIPRSIFDDQIPSPRKDKSDSDSHVDEDDDEFEEEEDFTPNTCLFCPEVSESTSSNLSHMSLSHNLIVPDLEHLLDIDSFLGYLSTIINNFHECLSCGGVESSKSAVQDHMRGNGHCRLNLEEDALELGDFWEVGESEGEDIEISGEEKGAVLVEGELRLPSGKILGRRTKNRSTWPKTTSLSRSRSSSPPQQPIEGQSQSEAPPSSSVSTVRITAPRSGPSNERRIVPRPGTSTSLIGLSDVQQRALRATEMKIEKVETKAKKMYEAKVDKKGNKQKTFRVLTMEKKAGGLEKRNG